MRRLYTSAVPTYSYRLYGRTSSSGSRMRAMRFSVLTHCAGCW